LGAAVAAASAGVSARWRGEPLSVDSHEEMIAMSVSELAERYRTDGYFTIDGLVAPDLLRRLQEAAPRVKAKARSGEVNLYNNYAAPGDPWVIDGILTSAFGEPAFAEFMVSEPLLALARAFLGPEIRLGYLGLLTNPARTNFNLGWHRDVLHLRPDSFDVPNDPGVVTNKFRWTTALADEANLRLVPGSHARWGTDAENAAIEVQSDVELPGQKLIELRAGQTVVYDEKIIHRAYTRQERERASLFGTWARYRPDEPRVNPIPEMRWMLRDGIGDTFPPSLRPYYDRWREIHQSQAPLSPLITHYHE
jgi:phytanoyl-CoA dioxygenase PhyH